MTPTPGVLPHHLLGSAAIGANDWLPIALCGLAMAAVGAEKSLRRRLTKVSRRDTPPDAPNPASAGNL